MLKICEIRCKLEVKFTIIVYKNKHRKGVECRKRTYYNDKYRTYVLLQTRKWIVLYILVGEVIFK
jgi:hypothetical protein